MESSKGEARMRSSFSLISHELGSNQRFPDEVRISTLLLVTLLTRFVALQLMKSLLTTSGGGRGFLEKSERFTFSKENGMFGAKA